MKKNNHVFAYRMAFLIVAIAIQFVWLFVELYKFSIQSTTINLAIRLLAILLAWVLFCKSGNMAGRMSWIFLILVAPVFGLALYLLFGRTGLTKKKAEHLAQISEDATLYLTGDAAATKQLLKTDKRIYNQSHYIKKWAGYPIYQNTEVSYYASGEEMFPVILGALESAKKFIFIEFFIIAEGYMLDAVLDVLERKAKEGVEIRIIYDDVGSMNVLPPDFVRRMQEKGIACCAFNPFLPVVSVIMNNRDHRKIIVVDGEVAFTGGINIADEYINRKERFGYWKDNGVMLEGKAVFSYTVMFLRMWGFAKNTSENYMSYQAVRSWNREYESDGFVQPYADAPMDKENQAENIYLNILHHAKDYVYIYTPYLVIDSEMTLALCNAAKSGVDVRIMMPGIPDKKSVFLLGQSYYRDLLAADVKIYQYTKGFLHAKTFLCDDEIATVGSVNLDYRSLYLHFECGVYLYQTQAIADIKKDMCETLAECQQITIEYCENQKWYLKLAQMVLRLFAPLL